MKRLEIWGDMIPGNSSRKKSLDMDIGKKSFLFTADVSDVGSA